MKVKNILSKIATFSLATMIAFTPCLVNYMPVYAEEETTLLGYVESTAPYILNIRSGPGLNYSIIGDFPHGTVAEWIGVSGGWYLVTYDGVTGYCAAEYTIPATEEDFINQGGTVSTTETEDDDVVTEDTDTTSSTSDDSDINTSDNVEDDVENDVDEDDIIGMYNSTDPCEDPEQSEYNTNNILTKISIPEQLFDDDMYILIYNLDLDNYYKINLNEDNDWTGDVWVPDGSYEVVDIVCETNEYYEFAVNNGLNFSVSNNETYTISGGYTITYEGSVAIENSSEDEDSYEAEDEDTELDEDVADESDVNETEDASTSDSIYPWRTVTKSSSSNPDITYDGLSSGDYSIVIQITHSGGIGEGLYKISYDGGSTYEDETEIVSDLKLAYTDSDGNVVDTGLTVHFSDDTYSIGQSYSFSTTTEWETTNNSSTGSIIYVTGVPSVDKTYNLEVEIIEGGSLGTATYQYTYDGETWSKETITPSDGIVSLSSGITFRLYGDEFTAGDTFSATVIGVAQETTDRTMLLYVIIGGIVVAVFAVLFIFFSRQRKSKNEYELIR